MEASLNLSHDCVTMGCAARRAVAPGVPGRDTASNTEGMREGMRLIFRSLGLWALRDVERLRGLEGPLGVELEGLEGTEDLRGVERLRRLTNSTGLGLADVGGEDDSSGSGTTTWSFLACPAGVTESMLC